MPIRPENAARYPADWRQVRDRILGRAGNRCEGCGVFNHDWGWRDHTGAFHRVPKRPLIDARPKDDPPRPPFDLATSDRGLITIIEIVLTIAHLDHTPENCHPDNLRAWCQRCHLNYDRAIHLHNAYKSRREGRAIGDLFEQPASAIAPSRTSGSSRARR